MLNTLRSAFKNSLIYGLGNISIKVIGLILFPIYTSELSVAEYGILGMLEVTSQIVIALFSLNIQAAFLRLYYDKEFSNKQGIMLFTTMIFLLICAGIMMAMTLPVSETLSRVLLHSETLSPLIKLMLISSGLQILNTIPSNLLRILERPTFYSVSMVIRLVVTLVLTIYFMLGLDMGIKGILLAQIFGHLVYLGTVSRVLYAHATFVFRFKMIRRMLVFSLPLVFSSVANVLLSVLDRYCLSFMGDMADVGIYSAGFKISNTLLLVFSSFQLALTPIIYQKINDDNNKRFYSKILTYAAFIGMILVLGMSLFGKEILKFLAQDPEYWSGYKIIPIISYGLFFNMLRYFATTGLNIAMKTKTIAIYTVITSILNIGLNILLISYFNFVGAAIATLISHFIFMILIYRSSQKAYEIQYEVRKVILILLISLGLLGLGYFTNDLSLFIRIAIKSLLIAAFPVILYIFRFYEAIELERIRQAWDKWSPFKKK
jgi:O-antigen/teichoic acid export membrane protein